MSRVMLCMDFVVNCITSTRQQNNKSVNDNLAPSSNDFVTESHVTEKATLYEWKECISSDGTVEGSESKVGKLRYKTIAKIV